METLKEIEHAVDFLVEREKGKQNRMKRNLKKSWREETKWRRKRFQRSWKGKQRGNEGKLKQVGGSWGNWRNGEENKKRNFGLLKRKLGF